MRFLGNVLAAVLGFFIALMLLFFMLLMIGAAFGSSNDEEVTVESNSVLALSMKDYLKDYGGKFDFEDDYFSFSEKRYNGLNNVLAAIEYAKTDDNIAGISLDNDFINGGIAQLQAVRKQLIDFKSSGKFIYSYADVYSQKDYYLASVADSIFINPVGELDFKGLATEILYYKDFEDKTGLKMEVIRHGKYKSAVEPYLSNKMSEANREQITVFLKAIWDEIVADIAESRNISPEQLNTIADELAARTPKMASEANLVDNIVYQDQYDTTLLDRIGSDDDEVSYINIKEYAKYADKKIRLDNIKRKEKIAVVYAQGQILDAAGNEQYIGPKLINESLKKAREDKKVKAIVLRVDSPGGSALASELIWREIELTKAVKPVVVSMGNVAASGGYYIACNADKIIAEPTTITGSIGVFGTLPNFKGFIDDIGINAEQVTTNKQAVGYSPFEPLSDDFKHVVQEGIEEVYTTFLQRVADGRGMSTEQVNEIAQGRVWAGTDAVKNGLVDELGGLDLALKHAAELGEVEEYSIKNYPTYKKDLNDILGDMGIPFVKSFAQSTEELMEEELGAEAYHVFKTVKNLSQQKGIQVRLPYEINIK